MVVHLQLPGVRVDGLPPGAGAALPQGVQGGGGLDVGLAGSDGLGAATAGALGSRYR